MVHPWSSSSEDVQMDAKIVLRESVQAVVREICEEFLSRRTMKSSRLSTAGAEQYSDKCQKRLSCSCSFLDVSLGSLLGKRH